MKRTEQRWITCTKLRRPGRNTSLRISGGLNPLTHCLRNWRGNENYRNDEREQPAFCVYRGCGVPSI